MDMTAPAVLLLHSECIFNTTVFSALFPDNALL